MAYDKIGRKVVARLLVDGRKFVTTAGTAVAMASSSTHVDWVIITAETNNTGVMAVGASTVVASLTTRRGTSLSAGESVVLASVDLADVYIDATVSTDGVTYLYRA